MKLHPVFDTDSYKASHYLQYPPGTGGMFCYLESRGGLYANTVFFGLQYILREYFQDPLLPEFIDEAGDFFDRHGLPFNRMGFRRISDVLGGKLPLRIRAVPEGTVVPVGNVLMTVESTDPASFWLVSYLETMLMRVWYPITVATVSWHCRKIIEKNLRDTADRPEDEIWFKLHDFGSRGVSSQESAAIGGAAHLVNFKGSDTVAGVLLANRYYQEPMSAFSIPAAEHSSITAWGKEGEVDAYRNMLSKFARPGSLVAVVSDSYDLYHAVEALWGGVLRNEVIGSGATLVVRPDSGDPPTVVLKTLSLLEERFGASYNRSGYKVLNHVRVIQGDGVNPESIRVILAEMKRQGYSGTNIAFGMGGALLQKVDRDTQKFAYKCSDITVDGVHRPVFKSPVTDPGKVSKKGRLDLVRENGGFKTVDGPAVGSELVAVYENGKVLKEHTLAEIRKRAWDAGDE